MFSDALPLFFYCNCKPNVVFTFKIILKTFTFMVLRSQEEALLLIHGSHEEKKALLLIHGMYNMLASLFPLLSSISLVNLLSIRG